MKAIDYPKKIKRRFEVTNTQRAQVSPVSIGFGDLGVLRSTSQEEDIDLEYKYNCFFLLIGYPLEEVFCIETTDLFGYIEMTVINIVNISVNASLKLLKRISKSLGILICVVFLDIKWLKKYLKIKIQKEQVGLIEKIIRLINEGELKEEQIPLIRELLELIDDDDDKIIKLINEGKLKKEQIPLIRELLEKIDDDDTINSPKN